MTYIENGGNASEAYRKVYATENYKSSSINEVSYRLLKKPLVAARIEALRKPLQVKHRQTVEDILREMDENREFALTGERPSSAAAVAATMGKAKILGYLEDRLRVSGTIDMTLTVEQRRQRIEHLKTKVLN